MHVDDVLLQVERVGEGFPAVVAQPGLHATPLIAGVLALVVVVLTRRRNLAVVVVVVDVDGESLSVRVQVLVGDLLGALSGLSGRTPP